MNKQLVIIDPQYDFCNPKGALFVKGADEDCKRLAALIDRVKFTGINVTLDSHHYFDIAHPAFVVDQNGKHPDPFTLITAEDVRKGKWRASEISLQGHLLHYVETLEKNSRYVYCIWPPHCLIGTPGHCVEEHVAESLLNWEKRGNFVNYITKGSNFKTEHYSAVIADVPDPNDPSTGLNMGFIKLLQDADIVYISGQALSHCVANTFRDVADNFGEDNIKKLVLLVDTCSNVGGFENLGEQFIKDMTARGMQVAKSTEVY